jgi:hypothetical protein
VRRFIGFIYSLLFKNLAAAGFRRTIYVISIWISVKILTSVMFAPNLQLLPASTVPGLFDTFVLEKSA